MIDDPTLCDVAQFTCEAATSRCLVTGPDGAPYWLDLDTGAKTRGPEALGTILARGAALSPDGRKVVEVRPDHQLVVHGVSDGSEVVIALDPPLDKDQHLLAAFWGQDALFVTTLGTPTPTIGLLSVRRDGHWNEVVRPKARQLYQIWLSPDGRSLALTANSAYWTYDYYAILPPL